VVFTDDKRQFCLFVESRVRTPGVARIIYLLIVFTIVSVFLVFCFFFKVEGLNLTTLSSFFYVINIYLFSILISILCFSKYQS